MGANVSKFQDFHGWKIPWGENCPAAKLEWWKLLKNDQKMIIKDETVVKMVSEVTNR